MQTEASYLALLSGGGKVTLLSPSAPGASLGPLILSLGFLAPLISTVPGSGSSSTAPGNRGLWLVQGSGHSLPAAESISRQGGFWEGGEEARPPTLAARQQHLCKRRCGGPAAVQGRVWPPKGQQGCGEPWVALTVTVPPPYLWSGKRKPPVGMGEGWVGTGRGGSPKPFGSLGSHKPFFLSIRRSWACLGWSPAVVGSGYSRDTPFVATGSVIWGTSSRFPGLEGTIFGMKGPGALPDTVPMGRMGSGLAAHATLATFLPLCADLCSLSPCPLACLLASPLPFPLVLPGPLELSLPHRMVQTPKSNA